jgi:hypothetical protein
VRLTIFSDTCGYLFGDSRLQAAFEYREFVQVRNGLSFWHVRGTRQSSIYLNRFDTVQYN